MIPALRIQSWFRFRVVAGTSPAMMSGEMCQSGRPPGEGEHAFGRLLLAPFIVFSLLAPAFAREAETSPPARDLAFGAYQRGDYATAMSEARKRVEANPKDAPALTLIGQLYLEGGGVKRDGKQAMDWFKRAADAGGKEAAYLYGVAALEGIDIPKDRAGARAYLEKAAAQDHPAALHLLGELALENGGAPSDFEKAVDYFRRAAARENADAAYALGVLYKNGKGVAKDDREAADWFKRAADLGLAPAMGEYAIMQFNGVGVPRDRTSAVALLRKAAAKGNPVAQNRLAHLLAEGVGVEIDLAAAREWRDKANHAGLKDPSLDFLSNAPAPKSAEPGAPSELRKEK